MDALWAGFGAPEKLPTVAARRFWSRTSAIARRWGRTTLYHLINFQPWKNRDWTLKYKNVKGFKHDTDVTTNDFKHDTQEFNCDKYLLNNKKLGIRNLTLKAQGFDHKTIGFNQWFYEARSRIMFTWSSPKKYYPLAIKQFAMPNGHERLTGNIR